MSTLERLKEIEETLKRYPESVDNLPVIWGEVAKAIPKLLAVVEAAEEASRIGELTKKLDDALRALEG